LKALGRNSKAVHRAYAKRAPMKIPSLEEYEQRTAAIISRILLRSFRWIGSVFFSTAKGGLKLCP
jgi:hypothetical protein